MTVALSLDAVSRSFRLANGTTAEILRDVNLDVEPGQSIAIMGRSGSGKSTLLNIMGLLDSPTSGKVACDGIDVAATSDAVRCQLRGAYLGFVFQNFYLFDRLNAWQNVAEPLSYASRREFARRQVRARELLVRVGLADRADSPVSRLSGGEQQRVAIARALVRSPKVILADEPTGSLDEVTAEQVLALLIEQAADAGSGLIIVTHDRQIAGRATRAFTLTEGRLHPGLSQ